MLRTIQWTFTFTIPMSLTPQQGTPLGALQRSARVDGLTLVVPLSVILKQLMGG